MTDIGADVDIDAVVLGRRARACAALRDAGVDVLVVGRPANLVYLTGARRVLVRGSRPFAPLAVLVPSTGDVFVQSATEGVAPHVYAQSWNPLEVARDLAAVRELGSAARVGVDAMTPGWDALLHELAPCAEVVAVDGLLRRVRVAKTPDELPLLQHAVHVALAGYDALVDGLRPGITERELRARFVETVARRGVTTLPHEPIVGIAEEAVVVDVGVVVDGYEAGLARTLEVRRRAIPVPVPGWARVRDAVASACRPGATGADLAAAARGVTAVSDDTPVAYGYGFGPEPPIGRDEVLADGTVLAVQARLRDGFARDMVLVTPDGGTLLTGAADAMATGRATTATTP